MTRPGPERILIVRLSSIGDIVHGLPLLCALRARLPQAHLAWVAESPGSALLEGHPALDELVQVPARSLAWLRPRRVARALLSGRLPETWRQTVHLRRRLSALRPDIAIDVQGLARSAAIAWLSGARRRIGFAAPAGREGSPWLNRERVTPRATHVVERNLELLRPLGIVDAPVRFDLPERAADVEWVERYRSEADLLGSFGLVTPGAGRPGKRWPPERFAAVAAHLGARWRRPVVVVWAGDDELELARVVVAGAGGHARLAPRTTLTQLAALARRASVFMGGDTGPLHLAAAVGTPCVGLYGPTSRARNGPYGSPHLAIQAGVPLTGPGRDGRPSSGAMAAITVAEVAAACDLLLARRGVGGTPSAGGEAR